MRWFIVLCSLACALGCSSSPRASEQPLRVVPVSAQEENEPAPAADPNVEPSEPTEPKEPATPDGPKPPPPTPPPPPDPKALGQN